MLYSKMTTEQRWRVFEDRENYPLRVSFLGKKGLLSFEEVAFLLSKVVDIDVDDRQFAKILAKPSPLALPPPPKQEARESVVPTRVSASWLGPFLATLLALFSAVVLALIQRSARASSGRRKIATERAGKL